MTGFTQVRIGARDSTLEHEGPTSWDEAELSGVEWGAAKTSAAFARRYRGGEIMQRKTLRKSVLGCSVVLAAAVSPPVARAAELTITFKRLADTVAPVPVLGGPKGKGTFDSLGAPSIDDGEVAFYAYVFPEDPLVTSFRSTRHWTRRYRRTRTAPRLIDRWMFSRRREITCSRE